MASALRVCITARAQPLAMEIVIVRHASRQHDKLTPRGRHQVDLLARALQDRGVSASLFLSSSAPYARHNRDLLAERLAAPGGAVCEHSAPLDAVSGNPGGIDEILMAARRRRLELGDHDSVLLVGHEDR